METNNNTPPTEPTPTPTPRPREQQARVIANGISQSKQVLKTLTDDATLRAALLPKGYDTQEINVGLSLQIAAQATFNERQRAIGEQENANASLDELVAAARAEYTDFRRVARVRFKAPGDRTKLGLNGTVPKDLQEFITKATASYTEAGKPPYAALLAKKGYDAPALARLQKGLDDIDPAVRAQRAADAAAVDATRTRDTAWGVLKNWMVELRETARSAFRNAPEQARKVDF